MVPTAVRNFGEEPAAAWRAALQRGHVDPVPDHVDEDQALRSDATFLLDPHYRSKESNSVARDQCQQKLAQSFSIGGRHTRVRWQGNDRPHQLRNISGTARYIGELLHFMDIRVK
jgi:hypothetical protein